MIATSCSTSFAPGTGLSPSPRNFPTPSANWGLVTHQAVFDATTVGNMLIYGALAASKNINSGDPAPFFAAGALDYIVA